MRGMALAVVAAAVLAGCGSSSSSGSGSGSSTSAVSSSLRHQLIAGYVHGGATPSQATNVADCVIRVLDKEGDTTGAQLKEHVSVLDSATARCKKQLGIP